MSASVLVCHSSGSLFMNCISNTSIACLVICIDLTLLIANRSGSSVRRYVSVFVALFTGRAGDWACPNP